MKPAKKIKDKKVRVVKKYAKELRELLKNKGIPVSAKTIANS